MNNSLPRYLLIAVGLTFGGLVASAAETASMAVVLKVTGTATAMEPGMASPQTLSTGDKLPQGSTITTGSGSVVHIQPFPGAVSTINENSSVSLDKLSMQTDNSGGVTRQSALLGLKSGTVVSMLDPTNKNINDYGVSTAKGVAAARGTDYTTVVEAGGVTISANADTVAFTTSDGTTYSISQGNVIITPPGGNPGAPISLATLDNNNVQGASQARAAIQAGVTAMAQVINTNVGNLGSAVSAQLAAQVITVSNIAAPSSAAANTGSIVAALSNSGASTTQVGSVVLAAVTGAPTQAAAIASNVASSLNTGANANTAATTTMIQATVQATEQAVQNVPTAALGGTDVTTAITNINSQVISAVPGSAAAILSASNSVVPAGSLTSQAVQNQATQNGVNLSTAPQPPQPLTNTSIQPTVAPTNNTAFPRDRKSVV